MVHELGIIHVARATQVGTHLYSALTKKRGLQHEGFNSISLANRGSSSHLAKLPGQDYLHEL